jgi:hypothetical protein
MSSDRIHRSEEANMSKGHDSGEKTKEIHKDAPAAEGKKPEHKKPEAPVQKGKGHTPMPGGCHSWGCKAQAKRFNFCEEHYEHFKFGLIKKTGEPVSDYEKKIEHYMAHKAKKGAQKVA